MAATGSGSPSGGSEPRSSTREGGSAATTTTHMSQRITRLLDSGVPLLVDLGRIGRTTTNEVLPPWVGWVPRASLLLCLRETLLNAIWSYLAFTPTPADPEPQLWLSVLDSNLSSAGPDYPVPMMWHTPVGVIYDKYMPMSTCWEGRGDRLMKTAALSLRVHIGTPKRWSEKLKGAVYFDVQAPTITLSNFRLLAQHTLKSALVALYGDLRAFLDLPPSSTERYVDQCLALECAAVDGLNAVDTSSVGGDARTNTTASATEATVSGGGTASNSNVAGSSSPEPVSALGSTAIARGDAFREVVEKIFFSAGEGSGSFPVNAFLVFHFANDSKRSRAVKVPFLVGELLGGLVIRAVETTSGGGHGPHATPMSSRALLADDASTTPQSAPPSSAHLTDAGASVAELSSVTRMETPAGPLLFLGVGAQSIEQSVIQGLPYEAWRRVPVLWAMKHLSYADLRVHVIFP